jgi:hypothetical protein
MQEDWERMQVNWVNHGGLRITKGFTKSKIILSQILSHSDIGCKSFAALAKDNVAAASLSQQCNCRALY